MVCRTLGIPNDVVDATEHLIGLADDFRPRKIDLGRCNGRHFVFACGVGLDATVVKRVDAHPLLKARARQWYYTWAAISGFYRHYLRNPVKLELEIAGETHRGRHRDRSELRPLHLLRQHPDPDLRGHRLR